MITREQALEMVETNLTKKNLFKHVLAVEAIMRALARRLGEDEELWGITGLLHDLDYESTAKEPEKHGYITVERIASLNLPPEVTNAILAHAGHAPRNSLIDKAIYCADPVTGLIVASALMHPSKRLEGIDASFVGNRFKEKRFAAGANREAIASCRELGLELQDFFDIAIDAMKSIADDLEL